MMNEFLCHLETVIDEMTEAAEVLISLVKTDDEIAKQYIEIFYAAYVEMLSIYGLMYAENEMNKKDVARWYPETLGPSAVNLSTTDLAKTMTPLVTCPKQAGSLPERSILHEPSIL